MNFYRKELDINKIFKIKKSYTEYFSEPTLIGDFDFNKSGLMEYETTGIVRLGIIMGDDRAKKNEELLKIFERSQSIFSNYNFIINIKELTIKPDSDDWRGIRTIIIKDFDTNYIINEVYKFLSEAMASIMEVCETRYHRLDNLKIYYDKCSA